jgi:hypothetical protein
VIVMATPAGIEPATFSLEEGCWSNDFKAHSDICPLTCLLGENGNFGLSERRSQPVAHTGEMRQSASRHPDPPAGAACHDNGFVQEICVRPTIAASASSIAG